MSNRSKTERIVSFKISDDVYLKLEKHAERLNISVQDCISELISEQVDNVETYYKMLAIDEEMDRVSFASND